MRRTGAGVALVVAVSGWCTGSCSRPEEPARPSASFSLQDGATRVFEDYDQKATSQVQTRRTRIPVGTDRLVFRIDCVNDGGRVNVSVSGLGGGGAVCRSTAAPAGRVDLDVVPAQEERAVTVTVVAPLGSHWSAAVDATR